MELFCAVADVLKHVRKAQRSTGLTYPVSAVFIGSSIFDAAPVLMRWPRFAHFKSFTKSSNPRRRTILDR